MCGRDFGILLAGAGAVAGTVDGAVRLDWVLKRD